MQKLALRDFEFHISATTWNAAQDLAHHGAVRGLQEVERHFWVAKVLDDAFEYEAEVIISPTRIKAFACGCWTEQRRFMCAHIGAALLKLRQFLQQKAEEKAREQESKAATPNNELTRLTIRDVLGSAPPEALADFVRTYARRDRDFALALKTWFAGSLTGAENPFLLVFSSVLPKTAAQSALRDADYRRLRRTLGDLEDQLSAALNAANLRTAYQVSAAVLASVGPLVNVQEEPRRGALLHDVTGALNELTRLAVEPSASPELRETAWEALLNGVKSGHFPMDLQREVTRFVSQATAADTGRAEQVAALYFSYPSKSVPTHVLEIYLASLAARGMAEGVVKVLDALEADTQLPYLALRAVWLELYYLQLDAAATLVAEYLQQRPDLTPGQRRELDDLLLNLAERTGDRPRQLRQLRQRYLQSFNPDLLVRLRQLAGDDWPVERNAVLTTLRDGGHTDRVADLLAAEGDSVVLSAYLAEYGTLPLLERHLNLLEPAFVRAQYTRLLADYLSEHFGRPGSAFAREALAPLARKGHKQLVINVIADLAAQFPDREGLAEELNELFPKVPRQWS